MPNITTCTRCGSCYEESSEERANESDRLCWSCFKARCQHRHAAGTATYTESRVAVGRIGAASDITQAAR